MKFQGSGFAIDLPDGAVDCSSYAFSLPALGGLPPNLVLRVESGAGVDMAARLASLLEAQEATFEDASFSGDPRALTRGGWEYFTYSVEFGGAEARLRIKTLHLLVKEPDPVIYVFTGTDQADNFSRFEPIFDAVVRSFQPNDVQRIR